MKIVGQWILGILGVVSLGLLIYGVALGFRQIEASSTGLTVHRPVPGYVCFLANRNDSLAMSCVREEE